MVWGQPRKKVYETLNLHLDTVVCAYLPSYVRGWDQEDGSSKAIPGKNVQETPSQQKKLASSGQPG
jgi:hypothetical protein